MFNDENANLSELLVTKLRSLYDVEQQLVKALPKVIENCRDENLKQAIENHFEETQEHVTRLERVFESLEIKPKALKSEAIRGLVADTEWVIDNVSNEIVRDAALAAAAQYVEHYEIAGYGSALTWAELLELKEPVSLLSQTLTEEQDTNDKLTELAESSLNQAALEAEPNLEEENEEDEEDYDESKN